jgi:predicted dehydrogenase
MDSNMKTSLIIGAGQLGSRHLQGLVKYLGQLEVYVLDPSIDSLKIAEARENEIIHNHEVFYTQSWEALPDFFDIVIVATSANIRESVINKLLENHKVRFLILEKVLFQELDAYQRVHDLLVKHNVNTYVNHPRRMFESYKNLKLKIEKNSQSIYSVVGGNWGVGCNALHLLDLFVYLSGKKLQDINVNSIEDKLLESSRKGFVEFTGTLTGHLSDGSFFSITSLKGTPSAITVTIFNNEQRFIIQEGGAPQIYELAKNNLFKIENQDFNIQYQSQLTTNIAVELFENNICSLPTFDEARHTHELFIIRMLEKYNKIMGLQATILPVT